MIPKTERKFKTPSLIKTLKNETVRSPEGGVTKKKVICKSLSLYKKDILF